MSDNSTPDFPLEESVNPQPFIETEEVEESEHINPEKELERLIDGAQSGNIGELHRWLKAATTVYIDNRRIGNYLEQEARIYGSVAGRDFINDATVKEVAGQVLIENIDKVRTVYVETASYPLAERFLKEKHLLILWGEQSLGKQTTAIHLLSSLPSDEIFEINPAIQNLSSFECETNQAYVIDTLAPDIAEKINGYVLNALSLKLRKQNSYFVITIDSRTRIARQEFSGYIFNWSKLPQSDVLLEKHLAWYLKEQARLVDTYHLIQAAPVRQFLKNKLLPGHIDQLAGLLAKVVVSEEFTLEDALAHFSLLADEQVESWFDKHPNLAQGVFMITLAVLNGCKYQTVDNASQRLQSLIQLPSQQEEASASETVFNTKRRQRLKEIGAHLVQGYENTEFGRSPVELIELDNTAFQPAILSYVWQEYERLREPLLVWLHELGSYSDLDVRIKAAAAVGELSNYAFGFVREKVLLPWANCQNRRLQRLVALALSIPVFESGLAPQVLGLLHHWSTVNNANLRWTATVAYGSYVGLRFPHIALRDLLAIAQSGERELFLAVAESVVNLFEIGKVFTVLNALRLWTSYAKITVPHQLGLLIFWMLMCSAKVPTDCNQGNLPALLGLAKEESVYEDLVSCLLRRSLDMKYLEIAGNLMLRKLVSKELHNWLKQVDEDPEHKLYPVLGSIIFTLAAQGDWNERRRIVAMLAEWASVGQPNAASKILSKIKKYLSI